MSDTVYGPRGIIGPGPLDLTKFTLGEETELMLMLYAELSLELKGKRLDEVSDGDALTAFANARARTLSKFEALSHDKKTWDIKLDRYERDNLVQLLRLVGLHKARSPALGACNTGDWVLQIYWKLGGWAEGAEPKERPNQTDADIRKGLEGNRNSVWEVWTGSDRVGTYSSFEKADQARIAADATGERPEASVVCRVEVK